MKLIVGLGNPGKKYEQTWHNAGFLAIDAFKNQLGKKTDGFKINKKFSAEIIQTEIVGEKIILLKPQTFMNNSGAAVLAVAQFYKILPQDIWIIHDEIDLPLGKIRISQNASAGGHKGVQSIIERLASKNFTRFRLGISSELKSKLPTEEYVLKKIGKSDKVVMNQAISSAVEAIKLVLAGKTTEAMNRFN